ncbi:MAG: hypothetical protein AB7N76_14495 [Planctomycetota bacterium]
MIDPSEVPEALRPAIPYATRWAIRCDVTRHDYFDKQPESDVADFYEGLMPYVSSINDWLARLRGIDAGEWPQAAVHFLYLLKAHSEAYQPTEDERRQAWEAARGRLIRRLRGVVAEIPSDIAGRIQRASIDQLLEWMVRAYGATTLTQVFEAHED